LECQAVIIVGISVSKHDFAQGVAEVVPGEDESLHLMGEENVRDELLSKLCQIVTHHEQIGSAFRILQAVF